MSRKSNLPIRRGYTDADIEQIIHGNWLRMLNRVLPAG
jgi:microsomal dipeptidase-like Zn-dependent dipeptidase